MKHESKLSSFYAALSEQYHLRSVQAVIAWDRNVYMPKAAAAGRAEQLQLLSTLLHQRSIDERFQELVFELEAVRTELQPEDQVNVCETAREIRRERKLPTSFISERALAHSLCHSVWEQNRYGGDFSIVEPALTEVVRLAREEISLVGYSEHPYDALLDLYEPGASYSHVGAELNALGGELQELLAKILDSGNAVRLDPLPSLSVESQAELGKKLLAALGYSFDSGRLDTTAHPFQTSLGRNDVRITTRYETDNFLSGLYSTLHELGHALYELGLPQHQLGTPCGSAVSLGIHESQSRFWENIVGRSAEFCAFIHSTLAEHDPQAAAACSSELIWQHANQVERSLIRVEADEVTYSLHVLIRMLLEEQLMTDQLSVRDLPQAWNQLYQQHLGLTPPTDAVGVMQDVHWYQGSFGYFPTYALGNLYAGMFTEQLESDLGSLSALIEQRQFAAIRTWLTEQIHRFGMQIPSIELAERAAKRPYSRKPFVSYLQKKFSARSVG